MLIERDLLLTKLNLIKPALGGEGIIIPILRCFWFTGDAVLAYNEKIGMSTKLEVDFLGGVQGEALLTFLKSTKARDVTLTLISAAMTEEQAQRFYEESFETPKKGQLRITSSSGTDLTLPMLPIEALTDIFVTPSIGTGAIPVKHAFCRAATSSCRRLRGQLVIRFVSVFSRPTSAWRASRPVAVRSSTCCRLKSSRRMRSTRMKSWRRWAWARTALARGSWCVYPRNLGRNSASRGARMSSLRSSL
jgi:hypothetical protein